MSPCSNGDEAEMFPDWASLQPDLVELIGCRVLAGDLQDYVRFRAVCSHWSASTARPRGRGVLDPRFHPRRWKMLPEGHPDFGGLVRFFNLDTGAFARAHLPLLADHVILDSADGLLVLHRNGDTAIRLLHPFTGDVAEFPPLASLLPQMQSPRPCRDDQTKLRVLMIARACVAVSSSGAISLMLALERMYRVAYATAGDRCWTLSAWTFEPFLRAVAFQGKLYAYHQEDEDQDFDIGMVLASIYRFDPPCPDADGDGQPRRLPLPVKIAECLKSSTFMWSTL